MADTYNNFPELKLARPGSYTIRKKQRKNLFLIFSPHGGGIEPGTTELCNWFNKAPFSFYSFIGRGRNCKQLHITSTNLNEPILQRMVRKHEFALSFHGMDNSEIKKYNADVFIGGRNNALINLVAQKLKEAGFSVATVKEYPSSPLCGTDKNNVTNLCASTNGLQIELSQRLRQRFFKGNVALASGRKSVTSLYTDFCKAVEDALETYLLQRGKKKT